jgi:signal transduction histidine kinase
MSHELRTPLNSIIGFTGILLQGLVGDLNEEQRLQLNMVQESSQHLLALINDVLDISKIEAGQLKVEFEPIDIPSTIEKIIRTVAPLADKKGLKLFTQIEPGVDIIISDQRRVEQILINLINNAIKFTSEGEIRIKSKLKDSMLVTSISDTGIGIKPENQKMIFQTFVQIDTGIARKHEGTGLGLSICKKLVEILGGNISVISEWNIGSTFSFSLPVKPTQLAESDQ